MENSKPIVTQMALVKCSGSQTQTERGECGRGSCGKRVVMGWEGDRKGQLGEGDSNALHACMKSSKNKFSKSYFEVFLLVHCVAFYLT